MKKILLIILCQLSAMTVFGQLDSDFVNAKANGDYCYELRNYDCAKKQYQVALLIKENDKYCKDKIDEIKKREIQRKKNKKEKEKYKAAQKRNATQSKPYYGKLKALIDEDNDKFDYVGYIQNGQPEGHGIADYTAYDKNSWTEEGEWHDGKQNGNFTGKNQKGDTTEVEYKDGKKNGKCTANIVEGSIKVELYFKDGKMDGVQKIFSPEGRIEISPLNNVFEGPMTIYTNDGTIISGYFKNSNFLGVVEVVKDGVRIVGYLKDSGFYSFVKIYYPNGNILEGYMENNLLDGLGKLTYKNGDILEGYFIKDANNIKGNATFSYINGNEYYGEYTNGSFNGKGKMNYKDGSLYDGQWLNGLYDGYGTFTVSDGYDVSKCPKCTTYVGWFLKGLKHGYGKCFNINDELIYNGKFKNDKPIDRYPSRIKK